MIELTTERGLIRIVAQRWHKQYDQLNQPDKHEIGRILDRLDLETVSSEEIARVIGNGSWTRITCDACGTDVKLAVICGEEPGYESSTAILCGDCLEKASALMTAGKTA